MTGNKTIDTAIAGLAILVTLGTLGSFVYTEMIYKKPLPSESLNRDLLNQEPKKDLLIEPFKLKPITINLRSPTRRLRFLEIEVHLVPFKEEYKEKLSQVESYLYDAIIDIAGAMEPDELNSISGKILLEERIKKRIQSRFNKEIVKEIFFSKFVVQ